MMNRREFLKQSLALTGGLGLVGMTGTRLFAQTEPVFKISLAQWSLHKTLFAGELEHLDFAKVTKNDYGDYGEDVIVRANRTNRVFAPLVLIPRLGSIYVTSSVWHARVFLDGYEWGTTPITLSEVDIGWHQLVVIKEDHRAYVENIHIEGGEELDVPADLEKI